MKNTIEIVLIQYFFILMELIKHSKALDIRFGNEGYCNDPLGMESGNILDDAITASSSYVANVGPKNGRLRSEKAGGGWCPKQQIEKGSREYLQVDLKQVHIVTGIQTQGRYDNGRGQEYAEEYTVEYWRPGLENWKEYKRWDNKHILRGNSDTATIESHRLMPPIFASRIRVLPYSIHRRTVCLRLELIGCANEGGILSYNAPQGSDSTLGLIDASYDGHTLENDLKGGLGRLVDGEIGADNFRLDIGYGKGNGWVGWKNDSRTNNFIELVFEFDQLRNFSFIHLYANNYFSKDVQVFSKAKIMFSLGGTYYNGRTLSYSYVPDRLIENARNISINLHNRIARFVKIRLFFSSQWILLSEITFDSVPVSSNFTDEDSFESIEDELIVNSRENDSQDSLDTVSTRKEDNSYIEIIVGILTAIMLLLLTVFVILLILSRRSKFQGSNSFFRNPFGVTMNMKDLLMNFSSGNNAVNSRPITPITHEPHTDSIVGSSQNYPASLVDLYYIPNCTTNLPSLEDSDEPPEIPPLPSMQCLDQSSIEGNSPIYCKSLESSTSDSPKSMIIDLVNFFPKIINESTNKKVYSAVVNEKQKLLPPLIHWNIAPSMSHPYNSTESDPIVIPDYALTPLEKLGYCHAGEISLFVMEGMEDVFPIAGNLVVARTTNLDHSKGHIGLTESLREVQFLAGLSDENICRIMGICATEQPQLTIIEYGDMGDLAQYLQFIATKNETSRSSTTQLLNLECLVYMATQIASGMKYLESKQIVHKDLATRNCLIGRRYLIKITDIAVCKAQYQKDYVEIGGRPPTPIRWLPWESILLDRYTCSSSVWAFAVTLWEILNFACETPFYNLTNEKVIQNAEHMYYGGELQVLLNKPHLCSTDLYELMCQCWKRDETERPTFKQIYTFLRHSNKDYVPID